MGPVQGRQELVQCGRVHGERACRTRPGHEARAAAVGGDPRGVSQIGGLGRSAHLPASTRD